MTLNICYYVVVVDVDANEAAFIVTLLEGTAISPMTIRRGKMAIKSNAVMEKTILGTVISWVFSDGRTQSIDFAKLSPAIQEQCGLLGLGSKVGDTAAIGKDKKTGQSVSIDEKFNAMKDSIAHLEAGEWKGERAVSDGFLLQAMLTLFSATATPEAIRTMFKGMDGKARTSMAALVEPVNIKGEIERLQAERVAANKTDVSGYLAQLLAAPPVDDSDTKKRREQSKK